MLHYLLDQTKDPKWQLRFNLAKMCLEFVSSLKLISPFSPVIPFTVVLPSLSFSSLAYSRKQPLGQCSNSLITNLIVFTGLCLSSLLSHRFPCTGSSFSLSFSCIIFGCWKKLRQQVICCTRGNCCWITNSFPCNQAFST